MKWTPFIVVLVSACLAVWSGSMLFPGCGSGKGCTFHAATFCGEGAVYWIDGCGNIEDQKGLCASGCNAEHTDCAGQQVQCTKDGDCDTAHGQTCDLSTHLCQNPVANCTSRCGGPDGAGGECPNTCGANQTCDAASGYAQCKGCSPDCSAKTCGQDDGCGGKCTACQDSAKHCNTLTWQCEGCASQCAGKCGGADPGCPGQQCPNTCTAPQICDTVSGYTQCKSRICSLACQSAQDCVISSGTPAFDLDNYACSSGACKYLGCNNDSECQATFNSTSYRCAASDYGMQCQKSCTTVADCVAGTNPPILYDQDNYSCTSGVCKWIGCRNDQECQAAITTAPTRCYNYGSGVPLCEFTCTAASDCNLDLSGVVNGAYGPDNYECRDGICWYLGCSAATECQATYASSYPGKAWVCQ